jgi:hypothetical protein
LPDNPRGRKQSKRNSKASLAYIKVGTSRLWE